MNVVELSNLEKRFAATARPAVSGISTMLPAGVITGLVGPDGAGKTTLMRLMAGLLLPTSGTIRVNGLDPAVHSAQLRDFVGYMPQRFGLYEDLTVRENLVLHADLRGVIGDERRAAFERLLKFTDLERFHDRFAGKLSGGMKQKLGLACALLGSPRLLLLDEPSVGVDPISRRELWRLVHELVSGGITVVWSSAYLDEAERCAQVLLLNEGQLLFAGDPQEMTGNLKDRCVTVRKLTGRRREVLARALRRPEVMDGVIRGHEVRLLLRPGVAAPAPDDFAAGDGAEVVLDAPRFEDAFIDALGGGPGGDSALAQSWHRVAGDHETVVEALDLTRKFGNFTAADRVNFSVKRGEVFGLLGPNGAGKSTTFRMMCGLLTPTSGTARVTGIDLATSPSQARQRLGYMAQKFSLYGNLSVLRTWLFSPAPTGSDARRKRRQLSAWPRFSSCSRCCATSAETLPLGFKQRLALACAVMHEPDILFLDEPTSGVDPVTRREFWTHINGLVERGITIVVTTHFMDEAEYCDHLALIFRGRVIAAGTPDQLKDRAATPQIPDPTMEDAFIHLVQTSEKGEAA